MAVNDIIADANQRADAAIQEAQAFINELGEVAKDESLGIASGQWGLYPWVSTQHFVDISEAEVLGYAGPDLREVIMREIDAPTDLSDSQPELWSDANVPEFTDQPLPLQMPDMPTTPVPTAPEDPAVRDVQVLAWEDFDMPDDPARSESAMPSVPTVTINETDLTIPNIDELVTVPENSFSYVENDYSSELKSALDNLLLSDLRDGGYGINPDDEQRLWERARDRQTLQNQAAIQKVRTGMAARGFPLPPGALYAGEHEVQMAGDAALNEVNREISLKRSDNYVQARQFAVSQGITFEGAMLGYVGAKHERALKASMAAADFVIQYHNASVGLVSLRIDVRRLYRDLHEEQRSSALATMESFKGALQVIDAEEGRNEGRLKFYAALRQSILDRYEVQRLRDQHTMLDAEIEKLKLEWSKVRAELFATKVRARSDEFDAYGKAITGERLKVDLFGAQASVFDTRVTAAVKEAQLKQARFEAELSLKLEERERVKVQIAKMDTQVRQAIAQANIDDQFNKGLLELWRGQQAQRQFNVSTKLQREVSKTQQHLSSFAGSTQHLQNVLTGINNFKELKASAAKSGVQLYETMVAGAESVLSAVTAITEAG